jgi:hypothetical protein
VVYNAAYNANDLKAEATSGITTLESATNLTLVPRDWISSTSVQDNLVELNKSPPLPMPGGRYPDPGSGIYPRPRQFHYSDSATHPVTVFLYDYAVDFNHPVSARRVLSTLYLSVNTS